MHTAASNRRSPRLKTDRGPWRPSAHIGFGLRIRPSWLSLAQEKLLRRRWLRPAPQVVPFFARKVHCRTQCPTPDRLAQPQKTLDIGSDQLSVRPIDFVTEEVVPPGSNLTQICTESHFNASLWCSSVMRKSSFHFVMRTTLSDRPANHSTTRFNANTSTTCTCLMV